MFLIPFRQRFNLRGRGKTKKRHPSVLEHKLETERKRMTVEEHVAMCSRNRARIANALRYCKK